MGPLRNRQRLEAAERMDTVKPTYEEIAQALIDLLDGDDADDIVYHTGLDADRANAIWQTYVTVSSAKERGEWKP